MSVKEKRSALVEALLFYVMISKINESCSRIKV